MTPLTPEQKAESVRDWMSRESAKQVLEHRAIDKPCCRDKAKRVALMKVMNNLTTEQKEQAAKALSVTIRFVNTYGVPPDFRDVEVLQTELAKVGLAIQPIEKCPTCGGEGGIDSGGVTPWGAGINIPCPSCNEPIEKEQAGE